jgi:fatty-acyl-CoA synthase
MGIRDRLTETLGLVATLRKARLMAPMRSGRYLRIAAVMRREGLSVKLRARVGADGR